MPCRVEFTVSSERPEASLLLLDRGAEGWGSPRMDALDQRSQSGVGCKRINESDRSYVTQGLRPLPGGEKSVVIAGGVDWISPLGCRIPTPWFWSPSCEMGMIVGGKGHSSFGVA